MRMPVCHLQDCAGHTCGHYLIVLSHAFRCVASILEVKLWAQRGDVAFHLRWFRNLELSESAAFLMMAPRAKSRDWSSKL